MVVLIGLIKLKLKEMMVNELIEEIVYCVGFFLLIIMNFEFNWRKDVLINMII